MKYDLTKKEIRHAYNNDAVFLWLRETINEAFNYEAQLLGAQSAERLFEIKGQAKVLRFFNNIDTLLDYLEEDD